MERNLHTFSKASFFLSCRSFHVALFPSVAEHISDTATMCVEAVSQFTVDVKITFSKEMLYIL
jgi:hypothetical protein